MLKYLYFVPNRKNQGDADEQYDMVAKNLQMNKELRDSYIAELLRVAGTDERCKKNL